MIRDLRDVLAELVVQPLLGWLAGKGTQMDDNTPVDMAARGYLPLRDVIVRPLAELHDQLQRMMRPYHPGGSVPCPVTGCFWSAYVPMPTTEWSADGGRVTVDGVPRSTVEDRLAEHLDWHAEHTETDPGNLFDQPRPCCDHHAGWADAPPCDLDDEDPDATDGVDPRTGLPLEQTGVNVRLRP